MSYHDISPAQIDIAGYIEALVRARLPGNVERELPRLDSQLVHLIDQRFAGAVRGMIDGVTTRSGTGCRTTNGSAWPTRRSARPGSR